MSRRGIRSCHKILWKINTKILKNKWLCVIISKVVVYNNPQEVSFVAVLKTVLTVIFILICLALTVIILLQEGKSAGLGAISGAADTYWGKNKGRSMEGILVKITRVLVILFIVIAAVLNIKSF